MTASCLGREFDSHSRVTGTSFKNELGRFVSLTFFLLFLSTRAQNRHHWNFYIIAPEVES